MKKITKNMVMGMSIGMCLGINIEKIGIPVVLCLALLIGLFFGTIKAKIIYKQFAVGEVVFMDEDGDIKKTFDKDE